MWERLQSRWLLAFCCRSPLAGDALACFFCASRAKSFRAPLAPELLSLCVAKEKGNQRERPPRLALAGLPARQVREGRPGFSTGLLSGRKRIGIPADPPAGLSSVPHRRTGAPGRATRLLRVLFRRARAERRFASAFHRVRAGMARCSTGAPLKRRAGGGKPAGWFAGMRTSLASGHDALSTNPVTRPRTLRARCPQSAEAGGRFLLVTSLLDKQKRSNSPSAGG
jgi:hypothetical protein